MIPGKKYTPEDLLWILWRRKWIVIVSLALSSLGTFIYARSLPDMYVAGTTILVIPQRIPDRYVQSTVTDPIENRLQSISEQILSRTRLERIIHDLNLYEEQRKAGWQMEDIVKSMRAGEIGVSVIPGGSGFFVSFISREPYTAMVVAQRLASLYIEENVRDRLVLADGTSRFLEKEVEEARARLIVQEQRLEGYRRRHAGELPTQVDSNLQAMSNVQMQTQALVESINSDRDRRLFLERALADAVAGGTGQAISENGSDSGPPTPPGYYAQQLAEARETLRTNLQRLKAEHPDIDTIKRSIRDLEQLAAAEAREQGSAPPGVSPAELAETKRQSRIAELREQIENLDREMATKQKDERSLRDLNSIYQSRVEAAPTRETELVELTRDYDTMNGIYASLVEKKESSKLAANLERRQVGEQFRILDEAQLPTSPYSPDRKRMNLFGAFFGLAFGVGLVALLEYRDSTLKSDEDVLTALALPVLASIPVMITTLERERSRRKKLWLSLTTAAAVVSVALVIWKFRLWRVVG